MKRKWYKIIVLLMLLSMVVAPFQALAAGGSVTVEIPFTVKGAPGTVVIEAVGGAPEPSKTVYENVTEGTFDFKFTEADDYLYRVYQLAGTQSGVGYDTATVYEIAVSVTFEGGNLKATVGINEKGSNYKAEEGIVFKNMVVDYAYLEIQKTAKQDGREIQGPFEGSEFVYEIRVENLGENSATNVMIIDALPTELPLLEIVKGSISHGGVLSSDGEYITWQFAELAPGESVTVSFTVHVPSVWGEVSWVNTAAAIYSGGNPLHFGAGGMSGSHAFDDWFGAGGIDGWFDATTTATATSTASATVAVPAPDVIIEKEQSLNGGPRTKDIIEVNPGDAVTYYLTVTNTSETTAEDVIVTDAVPNPPMMVLQENTITEGGTAADNVITWNLGDLASGESVTVSFSVTIPDVSKYTLWVNQAEGSYTYTPTSGEEELMALAGEERYPLLSNPVEAVYQPEGTSGPGGTEPGPGTSGPGGTPQTGDNSHLGLWIALMAASFTGLAVISRTGKKHKR